MNENKKDKSNKNGDGEVHIMCKGLEGMHDCVYIAIPS